MAQRLCRGGGNRRRGAARGGHPADLPATGAPDRKNPHATSAAEMASDISFNYVRLFGAYETGAIAQMWLGNWLSIAGSLPEFFRTWEYGHAKPLYNSLWRKISNPEYK